MSFVIRLVSDMFDSEIKINMKLNPTLITCYLPLISIHIMIDNIRKMVIKIGVITQGNQILHLKYSGITNCHS